MRVFVIQQAHGYEGANAVAVATTEALAYAKAADLLRQYYHDDACPITVERGKPPECFSVFKTGDDWTTWEVNPFELDEGK